MRTFSWILIFVLVLVGIVIIICGTVLNVRSLPLLRILYHSHGCTSFQEWSHQMSVHSCVHGLNADVGVARPESPHLILLNHITSEGLNSMLGAVLVSISPCKIVCYQTYDFVPVFGYVLNTITQPELKVDFKLSNQEKEDLMVRLIQTSLDRGLNVIMFVDARGSRSKGRRPIMRGLNRAVLGHFPQTLKQYIHLSTDNMPTGVIRYRPYPATYALDDILKVRTSCV